MKFSQKNIENWQSWKMTFFWVGHFEFFFAKKKKKFASSPWKLVTNYVLEWMGLNFQYYDGLQPKIRAGIINEHECTRVLAFFQNNVKQWKTSNQFINSYLITFTCHVLIFALFYCFFNSVHIVTHPAIFYNFKANPNFDIILNAHILVKLH